MGSDASHDIPTATSVPPEAARWHGRCYGFEEQRASWALPDMTMQSETEARPGYNSMSSSEYADVAEVLEAKLDILAQAWRAARHPIVYSGAGLSTAAGICDYASTQAETGIASMPAAFRSPFCAQPTHSHHVLVEMHRQGMIHRWVNQNHDGLPQKAGLPQEVMNEIHGAWHAPDNPVVPMNGNLRDDLFEDLLDCERKADLVVAVGTSLCGMNADRLVSATAERAAQKVGFGPVVIGLQQTVLDEFATLRIFGRCDRVFSLLATRLDVQVANPPFEGGFFMPPALAGLAEDDYVFTGLPYDAAGELCPGAESTLDLREDARVVITRGMHAGATGEVVGFDREGNVKCRFVLKPARGKLRAPVPMLIGRWWVQAALDGTVPGLPAMNEPPEDVAVNAEQVPGLSRIRTLIDTYSR